MGLYLPYSDTGEARNMDWQFIARHLISGCVPMTAALLLYFFLLRILGKKQSIGRRMASFAFCFYLVGILVMAGVCIRGSFSPRIEYIPFADMIRGPKYTALNILLFVPMGVFLPLLYDSFDRIGKTAAAGFLISLSVEVAQMFGSGTTDINDLITNTAGACLGYGLYRLLCRAVPQSRIRKIRVEGVSGHAEWLLFWVGACLIMLTIQIPIYQALFGAGGTAGKMHMWQ